MAQTIKIKRSDSTSAPSSLVAGELAYSGNSDKLFIGHPDGTTGVITIGGTYYTSIVDGAASANTASKLVIRDASGNFSAGAVTVGSLVVTGTVDGVDIATRDGILTSTTTTAGAALPKAGGAMTGAITTNSTFDGVDIATRDGILSSTTTTAAAALPKAGGAMTGAITTNSTFDGRDVATDGTKLDTIATSANNYTLPFTDNSADWDSSNSTAAAALPKAGGAMTGAITTNSTFDGRDVGTDGTKLDTIATSANNYTLPFTNNSTNWNTAYTTAAAALPKAGGAMTGAITTNSTFDGRDVATDGTKLDGVEASADVTDATNVAAAGALMDSELASIADVKALNQGVTTTSNVTFNNVAVDGTLTSDDIQATTLTASGHVIVTGDLTVNGTTTTVNSNTVAIGDAIMTLNSDEAGTPSANAGLEVERGTEDNVTLLWNESSDYWQVYDGTTTSKILTAGNFAASFTGIIDGGASF